MTATDKFTVVCPSCERTIGVEQHQKGCRGLYPGNYNLNAREAFVAHHRARAKVQSAKDAVKAIEAEPIPTPAPVSVPQPSARLVAARAALISAQREYDAAPPTVASQAKLDAAKVEVKAAEAA